MWVSTADHSIVNLERFDEVLAQRVRDADSVNYRYEVQAMRYGDSEGPTLLLLCICASERAARRVISLILGADHSRMPFDAMAEGEQADRLFGTSEATPHA